MKVDKEASQTLYNTLFHPDLEILHPRNNWD